MDTLCFLIYSLLAVSLFLQITKCISTFELTAPSNEIAPLGYSWDLLSHFTWVPIRDMDKVALTTMVWRCTRV